MLYVCVIENLCDLNWGFGKDRIFDDFVNKNSKIVGLVLFFSVCLRKECVVVHDNLTLL